LSKITLDDGMNGSKPEPGFIYPTGDRYQHANTLRGGDTVSSLRV